MEGILLFFSHPVFTIIGGISTLLVLFGFLYAFISTIKGVLPALIRLGSGLSNRKIAVFGGSRFDELKNLLVDSGIFKERNIIQINSNEIEKAADITLMLVYWKDFSQQIDQIFHVKKYSDALIVYAPPEDGWLSDKDRNKINSKQNSLLVNFRGRLLNDIMASIITTTCKR